MLKRKNGQVITPPGEASQGKMVIKNGRVIDPANGVDDILHVIIDNGLIVSVNKELPSDERFDREIDAQGCWVVPGLIDIHVHLREPGREDKETIFSGTCAAAAGGFTSIACMPNTTPALDEESKIRYVIQRSAECPCRVYPIGALTKGIAGDELSPFGEMVRVGAKGFSDDGVSVSNAMIMRNAFNYSKAFNIPLMCHSEDADLAGNGHMNEGEISTQLGLRGIPAVSEDIMVSRDLLLAEYTNARVHICHVSSAGSVRIIAAAKKRGVKVTCETAPHYIALTENDLLTYDTHKKMNPPLRTEKDRQTILEGLKDGTIDAIATDHAPHVPEDKDVEFDAAAFGVIGLETTLGVAITHLIKKGILSPSELIKKMSLIPGKILNLDGGTLTVGKAADITIIDPEKSWKVEPQFFFSKGRNCAFENEILTGQARYTILRGTIVFERNE